MNPRIAPLVVPFAFAACIATPPVLRSTRVTAPIVPPQIAVADAHTFGWLRAHQLVRMLQRVGAGALLDQVKVAFDPGEIEPDKNIVIVVGEVPAEGGVQKTPLMAVVPVGPQSRLATMATALLGAGAVAPFDGSTAVAVNAPPVDETHGAPLLRALAKAPLVEDLELFFNLAAITARYAPDIQKGLEQMKVEMAKPQANGAALDPAFADAYVDWLKTFIDASDSVTIGAGAGEKDINVYTVTRDKGAGQAPVPTEATSMPDLAQFIPVADMRVEIQYDGMRRLFDMSMKLYAAMFKGDPATFGKFKAILDEWMKGDTQLAMGLQLDGERFMHGAAVMLSSNAEGQIRALRQSIELLDDEGMKKWMKKSGSEVSATLVKEARSISGWPVDKLHYSIKIDPTRPGMNNEMLRKLLERGFDAEYVRAGSYIVMAYNEPPAALDKIVGELMAGKGSAPSLVARGTQPAGGWLYGDVDAARSLRDLALLLPAKDRADLPQLDEAIAPVTLFGYSAGTTSYYRAQASQKLVDGLRQASAHMHESP